MASGDSNFTNVVASGNATVGGNLTVSGTTLSGETVTGSLIKVSETILYSAFTDGGSTSGTKALATQIPVGARFVGCHLTALTGFTGDTTAVVIIGDGSDTDRYM